MCPNVEDKSQIISPYKCKNDAEIKIMQKTLDRVDKKIDLIITTNEKLSVQEEKITNLEDKVNQLTSKLWYIAGGTIIALISAFIKLLL